jgi:hypothetical protein
MKLTLDHTQRLNLHALLGAQRADVSSIRAIWAVQDKIELSADEEKVLELKHEMAGGQERVVWNADSSLPFKDFEFTEAEIARIKAAIGTWTLTLSMPTGDGCSPCSGNWQSVNPPRPQMDKARPNLRALFYLDLSSTVRKSVATFARPTLASGITVTDR